MMSGRGLILGARAGLVSQVIYILIGLSGIPVFSGGGGIGYISSPTFGYIIGFAAAAHIIGLIKEKLFPGNESLIKYIIASLIGLLVCYVIGLSYMFLILKYVNHATPQISKLIVKGFIIFLPWDTVKIIAASWVAKETMRRLAFLNTQRTYLSNDRNTTSDF